MESIYELENNKVAQEYMKEMKAIMIKGVGYFLISKKQKLTPDLLLNIAISMERQNIKSI
jgi:hypothetical protein